MKDLIINYLKAQAARHVMGIGISIIVIAVGASWLKEHDARILAEATVKQSQDRVSVLQQDREDIRKAGEAAIAKLQRQAETVKTPAQAIAALPQVSPLPLNPAPLPDAPNAVRVDALPLFQTLNKCQQCEANLATAQAVIEKDKEIGAEKDKQIAALSHKKSFWKRALKYGGCGAAEVAPFFIAKPGVSLPVAGGVALACQLI
jgi:hypothetical protein